MLQVTKDQCVPRLKNCAEAPLSLQPEGLSITEPVITDGMIVSPSKYYCGDCFEGFYWNEDLEICSQC